MNEEKTTIDNLNQDNERTAIYDNATYQAPEGMPIPPVYKEKKNKMNATAGIAAGAAGVAAVGTAATAYAMSDTDAPVQDEEEEEIADNTPQVDETAAQPQAAQQPHYDTPRASATQHDANTHANYTHAQEGPDYTQPGHAQAPATAQHVGTTPTDEPEIEVLGVVHDDETNSNIAAMTVDGQEVYLIDVDNNQSFDYLAVDADNNGQFSSDEISDISAQNITVADLGGFSNQEQPQTQQHYAENNTTRAEEPVETESLAYNDDPSPVDPVVEYNDSNDVLDAGMNTDIDAGADLI